MSLTKYLIQQDYIKGTTHRRVARVYSNMLRARIGIWSLPVNVFK